VLEQSDTELTEADQSDEPELHQEPAPVRRQAPSTIGARIVDPKLGAARREVKVVMYSAPWCSICDRARTFLTARQVQLEEHDIERSASAEKQLVQINAAGSVPTFIVEQKAIVGFHPWGLEDAIDEAARSHYCADDLEAAVCERPRLRR
jgi:glutaredoxin